MTKAARRQFLPALEETGQPKPSFGDENTKLTHYQISLGQSKKSSH
ncbi:MAG: hypothetical protein KME30_16930 [Iphinoe sp. HA4291-MV1]|nr:hypothetical protein [Iphinoe sp. HA4291-MV1]